MSKKDYKKAARARGGRIRGKSKKTKTGKKEHIHEFNPFNIIKYPYVTEKTMNLMENLNRFLQPRKLMRNRSHLMGLVNLRVRSI